MLQTSMAARIALFFLVALSLALAVYYNVVDGTPSLLTWGLLALTAALLAASAKMMWRESQRKRARFAALQSPQRHAHM